MSVVVEIVLVLLALVGVIAACHASARAGAISDRLSVIQQMLAAGLQRQGVSMADADMAQAPCRICAKKGRIVRLARNKNGLLACPSCGGVRQQ